MMEISITQLLELIFDETIQGVNEQFKAVMVKCRIPETIERIIYKDKNCASKKLFEDSVLREEYLLYYSSGQTHSILLTSFDSLAEMEKEMINYSQNPLMTAMVAIMHGRIKPYRVKNRKIEWD